MWLVITKYLDWVKHQKVLNSLLDNQLTSAFHIHEYSLDKLNTNVSNA